MRVDGVTVVRASPPKVGFTVPGEVRAEVSFVLPQPKRGS